MDNPLRATRASAPATVSAVIPVYNGEAFLGAAIESVLRQTRAVDEVLVVDDGSTDNSAEIAHSYPGVRVLSFANAGLSTARNRGVAEATSTWIALLDCDDLWLPYKMERQMAKLAAHPEADVCVSGYQVLEKRGFGRVVRVAADFGAALERGACATAPSCVVLRRSALLAVGGFDAAVTSAEDWDCWLRLKRAGANFVSCTEPLVHYRRHDTNLTNDPTFLIRGDLEIFERYLLPNVPRALRPIARWRHRAKLEGDRSILEREAHQPHLGRMLRSVAMWPVGNWRRYKIAAHMILKRIGVVGRETRIG